MSAIGIDFENNPPCPRAIEFAKIDPLPGAECQAATSDINSLMCSHQA